MHKAHVVLSVLPFSFNGFFCFVCARKQRGCPMASRIARRSTEGCSFHPNWVLCTDFVSATTTRGRIANR
jgi:hypothetical protein